jgi:hypothetical protein
MGWASGTCIMEGVIAGALDGMPNDIESRKRFYRQVIPVFEGYDWDTQDECLEMDQAFDEVMWELHPDWMAAD